MGTLGGHGFIYIYIASRFVDLNKTYILSTSSSTACSRALGLEWMVGRSAIKNSWDIDMSVHWSVGLGARGGAGLSRLSSPWPSYKF